MGNIKITFYGGLVNTTYDKEIEIEASTIKEALHKLTIKYGKNFEERVYDETKNLRRYINIYINGRDVRFLDLLDTTLKRGDNISIMPAVSGG